AVALGLPDGTYEMFGAQCVVAHGAVRLARGGQLAGSCLTMDRALQNLRRWQPGLPLAELLAMASRTPAAAVGIGRRHGTIAPGAEADMVLLNAELQVQRTFRAGVQRWPD
ncbi:MAG TPA: amidohydrolase family protein, partial [Candidatus Kryptonia bacterium]|nr:amidohydrolase family protein [Candidatus Kryptonia bacterium]